MLNNKVIKAVAITILITCFLGASLFPQSVSASASASVIASASASVSTTSNSKINDTLWHFDYMDIWEAWDLIDAMNKKYGEGKPIIVASVDAGVNTDLSCWDGMLDFEHSVKLRDGKWVQQDGKPIINHGTGVLSAMIGRNDDASGIVGAAAGNKNNLVQGISIDVFPENATDYRNSTTTANIIKGIEYACAQGAKVISLIMGHNSENHEIDGDPYDEEKLQAAISKAIKKYDVIFISSAGNTGDAKAWYPSDYANTLSIINSQEYTNAYDAKSCKYKGSNYGKKKDLCAPGRFVKTCTIDGNLSYLPGTSISSALVCAVAVLVRYANPKLSAAEVKQILIDTAIDLGKEGKDIYTGYGMVNAYNAVVLAYKKGGKAKSYDSTIKVARKFAAPKKVKCQYTISKNVRIEWSQAQKAIATEKEDAAYVKRFGSLLLQNADASAVNAGESFESLANHRKYGTINFYKVYRASSKNGKYKLIGTTTSKSFTDKTAKKDKKLKSARGKMKRAYYKIVACGTSPDGKKMTSKALYCRTAA